MSRKNPCLSNLTEREKEERLFENRIEELIHEAEHYETLAAMSRARASEAEHHRARLARLNQG